MRRGQSYAEYAVLFRKRVTRVAPVGAGVVGELLRLLPEPLRLRQLLLKRSTLGLGLGLGLNRFDFDSFC